MFQYLALTDGVTTVELTDGINYALVSYAPVVAPLRDNKLGGDGQYADVTETLTFHAIGCTAADAYAAAAAVNLLLDQARRWWQGQAVNPVRLVAQAQGSSLAPLSACLKGRAPNAPPNLVLPAVYHEYYGKYVIEHITVQVVRRALWIGLSESASAGAVANPAVLTVTMPSAPSVLGPLEIDFTGFTTAAVSGNIEIPSGFVFVGPNNAFSLQQGESPSSTSMVGGMSFSSVADAAARASAGNVGRLNASIAKLGIQSSLSWTLPAAFLTATRIGIFLTYRNNSASAWTLRAASSVSGVGSGTTRDTAIDAVANNPTVLFLGEISNKFGFDTAILQVIPVSRSGADTLDIDTILIVDLTSDALYTVAFQANQFALGGSFASKNAQFTVNYSPNTLRDVDVKATVLTTAAQLGTGYNGDAAIMGAGGTLQAVWYATHVYNGTTPYWTTQNITGAAILSIGATITRRLAALVPQ